jgi:hypothetical protein
LQGQPLKHVAENGGGFLEAFFKPLLNLAADFAKAALVRLDQLLDPLAQLPVVALQRFVDLFTHPVNVFAQVFFQGLEKSFQALETLFALAGGFVQPGIEPRIPRELK